MTTPLPNWAPHDHPGTKSEDSRGPQQSPIRFLWIRMLHLRRSPIATKVYLLLLILLTLLPAQAQKNKPSGAATYALTKELLAVAPKRFNGSPGHLAAENFIKSHFAPEEKDHRLEVDSFSASTPAGQQSMRNIIVKFPAVATSPKKDGILVLGSHYETNYNLKDIAFVGANDGASTSALLIEIGQHLRAHPPEGYSIWLVFFDGEEAVKEWSDRDSLYGSRHLAARLSQDGTIGHVKAFLNADMIGDRDLNITHDDFSTPALLDLLKVAAKNTGHSGNLYRSHTGVLDDTVPFAKRGVPVLDIVDLDYGPMDNSTGDHAYHHTVQDTIDKISPQSLQISADLFMEMINLLNQR